jgi:hypothetical protein
MLVSLQVWINCLYLWLAVHMLCSIVKLLVSSGVLLSFTDMKEGPQYFYGSYQDPIQINTTCSILMFDL